MTTIIHLGCSPKFCKTNVFELSWDDYNSQEKMETMVMQNLWRLSIMHYGLYANAWNCARLDRCCVELHNGTVFRMLSLILLAITRLRRNWVKIRPLNSPTMQWDTTQTQSHSQHQGARAIRLLYRSDRRVIEELFRVRTNVWIQSSRLFSKTIIFFPASRLSNLVINTFRRFPKNRRNEAFFMIRYKLRARLNKTWLKRKEFHL